MYAPDLDGRADPGEIVWTWVVYEDDPTRGKDRPVLVVGRDRRTLLGLMLSSQEHHRNDPNWVSIGSGSWFDAVVVKSIASGRLGYPGDPRLVHAWAYLPDLARAFVAVASLDDLAPFERFTFAGHSVRGSEFLAAVERAAATLGLAPVRGWRRAGMPWPLIRVAGVVMPLWRELARMSYLWRVPHALAGTKLARRCPALTPTPLTTAVADSLIGLGFAAAPARTPARATG